MAERRLTFLSVLGAVMVGLGLLIVVRLLARGGQPMTASLWLDLLFALFFLVRGGMHLRTTAGRHRSGTMRRQPPEDSGRR